MAIPMTFTAEEASNFVKDLLRIPDPHNGNKLEFLNQIVCGFKANIPCHNLSLLASGARDFPEWSRVKAEILTGRGDLGCALNVFLAGILKALNYEACLNKAVMYALDAFNVSHVIVLVLNLVSTGDCYLVDVGTEYPTLEAIPLSFKEESPVYHQSYLEYKFMKRSGRILRLHNRGQHDSKAQIDASLDGFYVYYDFDLESKTEQDLENCFSLIYTNPRASPFHKSFRASIFPNGVCKLLKCNEFYAENESHKLVSKGLSSVEGIRTTLNDHFPMIPVDVVSKALEVVPIT